VKRLQSRKVTIKKLLN